MLALLIKVRESIERYVISVITREREDLSARCFLNVLSFLSRIFSFIVQIRLFLYKHRILRRKTLGCMTISIGNLTVGGTGKTPIVEMFARSLEAEGRKVAILSRGYRSASKSVIVRFMDFIFKNKMKYEPKIVSDGRSILLDSLHAGDEPYMLAKNVKNAIVLVDKNRVKSGAFAIEKYSVDTLLLDDGFQYLPLDRRYDVVLIDATSPFGNEKMLPRGELRETVNNLKRANIVFITKAGGKDISILKSKIRTINPKAEIIICVHKPLYFEEVYSGNKKDIGFIDSKRIVTLSAIAKPKGFEIALEEIGAQVILSHRFMDHHRFSQQEIINVINDAINNDAEAVVTTEKDSVRFPYVSGVEIPIYFLRVKIEIMEGAKDFHDCVSRICFS
ncbi:MAG: tetraacyldisaccharide 4'-kinase [Candidatus Aureabacteria bacterium]|nr:tetraacyldisaccharide 4'-kinase [Candidatus Auribacterota bacterium]